MAVEENPIGYESGIKPTSTDAAISQCNDKIALHRREGRIFLSYILGVLLFFGAIQVLNFSVNATNQNKLEGFLNQLNYSTSKIEGDVIKRTSVLNKINSTYKQYSLLTIRNSPNYLGNSLLSKTLDSIGRTIDGIDSTNTASKLETDTVTTNLRKLPLNLQSSLLRVDNTLIYVLYGIFVLVFGVMTSFYRYHLKEVSKYEHFLLGLQRVRIAAQNPEFSQLVKEALLYEAFVVESRPVLSKRKQIESPIQGYPTSDAATFVLNKIMDSIEFTAKPKI